MKYLKIKDNVTAEQLQRMGFEHFYNCEGNSIGMQRYLDDEDYVEFWWKDNIIEAYGKRAMGIVYDLIKADMVEVVENDIVK